MKTTVGLGCAVAIAYLAIYFAVFAAIVWVTITVARAAGAHI